MLIEAFQQTDTGLSEMLALADSSPLGDVRKCLGDAKSLRAKLDAFCAKSALLVAAVEHHGDSGTGVLVETAGVSRREAHSHTKTAKRLREMPRLRKAVESGQVSFRNATRLAKAADSTSTDAVESDTELLAKAATLTDDQFARTARRWSRDHQADQGEAQHARLRQRRSLRIFDGNDGMKHLRGCLDPVTGTRFANRLRRAAKGLYDADKKGTASGSAGERRSFDQCMADALEVLTTGSGSIGFGSGSNACETPRPGHAEISIIAQLDESSGRLVAEVTGGEPLPPSILEELMCNSTLTGVLFSSKGVPLWQGYTKRSATAAQLKALRARDQGCIGCGANPVICQAHHVMPWSKGGSTDVTNMVLVCWNCHNKIHHHNWQVTRRHGKPTLVPPNGPNYGPARAEPPTTQTPRHIYQTRPPPKRSRDGQRKNKQFVPKAPKGGPNRRRETPEDTPITRSIRPNDRQSKRRPKFDGGRLPV